MGAASALAKAVEKTWDTSVFSLRMLGRMLIGQVSWKNLSGPVTIGVLARLVPHKAVDEVVRAVAAPRAALPQDPMAASTPG